MPGQLSFDGLRLFPISNEAIKMNAALIRLPAIRAVGIISHLEIGAVIGMIIRERRRTLGSGTQVRFRGASRAGGLTSRPITIRAY